ncbi:transcription factor bHLH167-like [Bidens hawaiensis]|uniref:transcription factor bHLH167-like n=1 Tax=Bidens hawaiensis TaxID=980011 RepID=UPI00404A9508
MRPGSSSSHAPPAEKEKQRRDRMKDLYSILAALLNLQPYESKSLPAFLDQATTSLQHLKEKVDRLKVRKEELEKEVNRNAESSNQHLLKLVHVTEPEDLKLEVNLIFTMNNKRVVPVELYRVIEQGGAEITSLYSCTIDHNIYCTIHAQAFQPRIGFDAKQIEAQLKQLVY